MKKRIAELEVNEKKELEEHQQKLEKEAQEDKSTISNAGGTTSLPKYQELFKSPSAKLPPLPPLPKFENDMATYAEANVSKLANRVRTGAVLFAQLLDEQKEASK